MSKPAIEQLFSHGGRKVRLTVESQESALRNFRNGVLPTIAEDMTPDTTPRKVLQEDDEQGVSGTGKGKETGEKHPPSAALEIALFLHEDFETFLPGGESVQMSSFMAQATHDIAAAVDTAPARLFVAGVAPGQISRKTSGASIKCVVLKLHALPVSPDQDPRSPEQLARVLDAMAQGGHKRLRRPHTTRNAVSARILGPLKGGRTGGGGGDLAGAVRGIPSMKPRETAQDGDKAGGRGEGRSGPRGGKLEGAGKVTPLFAFVQTPPAAAGTESLSNNNPPAPATIADAEQQTSLDTSKAPAASVSSRHGRKRPAGAWGRKKSTSSTGRGLSSAATIHSAGHSHFPATLASISTASGPATAGAAEHARWIEQQQQAAKTATPLSFVTTATTTPETPQLLDKNPAGTAGMGDVPPPPESFVRAMHALAHQSMHDQGTGKPWSQETDGSLTDAPKVPMLLANQLDSSLAHSVRVSADGLSPRGTMGAPSVQASIFVGTGGMGGPGVRSAAEDSRMSDAGDDAVLGAFTAAQGDVLTKSYDGYGNWNGKAAGGDAGFNSVSASAGIGVLLKRVGGGGDPASDACMCISVSVLSICLYELVQARTDTTSPLVIWIVCTSYTHMRACTLARKRAHTDTNTHTQAFGSWAWLRTGRLPIVAPSRSATVSCSGLDQTYL